MRKIVSVQRIDSIEPIPNGDFIETAKIKGWNIVVKKGDFKVGDHCAYFEIDSFIPVDIVYFKFLEKYNRIKTNIDNIKGYVIKTVKLRGVISQGLIVSIQDLKDNKLLDDRIYNIGESLSLPLNVSVYEPMESTDNNLLSKGSFPAYIQKSDQERIQNLPEYFINHKLTSFEMTEKLDGSSCTIYYNEGQIGICSRTIELQMESNNIYTFVNSKYLISNKLEKYCRENNRNLALQGEIIGSKIQSNHYQLAEIRFYLYDIYDIDKQSYLSPLERREINSNYLELPHVPKKELYSYIFADYPTMEQLIDNVSSDENHSDISNLKVSVEGFVFKSNINKRISFKVINNNYLLSQPN